MADGAFVYSPDGLLEDFDETRFAAEVTREWPSARIFQADSGSDRPPAAHIRDEDGWVWQIFLLGDDDQLAVEGAAIVNSDSPCGRRPWFRARPSVG